MIKKGYSEEPSFSQLALSIKETKWKNHWLKKYLIWMSGANLSEF